MNRLAKLLLALASILLVPLQGIEPSWATSPTCLIDGFSGHSGQNFTNCDFSFKNISNGSFVNSNLTGANLTGAVLTNVDFTDANLQSANLAGVHLEYVKLINTNLEATSVPYGTFGAGITSSGITGTPASLPPGWVLANGHLIGPSVDLSGWDLQGADLSGADLTNIKSGSITGVPSALPPNWTLVSGYLVGPGVNLKRTDLSGLNLTGADLSNSDLSFANLTNANLTSATFSNAKLSAANLTNATFSGANFTGLITTPALGANWPYAPLTIFGTPASMPANYHLIGGYIFGPGVVVRDANFNQLDLSGLNLSQGADFYNSKFHGATLNGVDLSNANLMSTDLTFTNLINVNLTDANLMRADLTSATLQNSTVNGTQFSNNGVAYYDATLTNLQSSGLIGTPSPLPIGWTYYDHKILQLMTNHPKPIMQSSTYGVNTGVVYPQFEQWDSTVQLTYQWLINGSAIPGATEPTYTPKLTDVNKNLSVAVTGSQVGYKPHTSISDTSLVLPGQMPVTSPTIFGTIKIGKTIRVVTTPWVSGASISIQWLLDGKSIKGATKTKFTLPRTSKKHQISVKVTQSKTGYTKISIRSQSFIVG